MRKRLFFFLGLLFLLPLVASASLRFDPKLDKILSKYLRLSPNPQDSLLSEVKAQTSSDWPMLQHDAQHSGYSSEELIPTSDRLNVKWKIGLGDRIEVHMQPIVAYGKVYLGVMNSKFYAIKALPRARKTKKVHPFDRLCQQHKIQHRTIKFKHPWTNGMVERFNRTLKDQVLKKYLFSSIFEMNGQLIDFVNRYNFEKRLKSLNYKTPAQYLKETKNISIQRIVS